VQPDVSLFVTQLLIFMTSSRILALAAIAAALLPAAGQAQTAQPDPKLAEQMARGKKVYTTTCVACHQANGQGVATLFPPLAKSDYLMADKARSIRIVLKGQSGPITVNGKQYNQVMPPQMLKPEQVADVLTFVRNSWGNSGEPVTVAEVDAIAKEIAAEKKK
jgi:nitrite reductase (NO-forming)